MKLILFILLLLLCGISRGQIIVKSDSIVEKHGCWARLRGRELKTNRTVFFVYKWMGAGRPEIINQWYTIYWPVPKRQRGRLIYVQKNN